MLLQISHSLKKYLFLLVVLIGLQTVANAQIAPVDSLKADSLGPGGKKIKPRTYDLSRQYDFGDLVHDIIHHGEKRNPNRKGSGITVVPNVSANPTIGFQGGIKAVAGKKLGDDPNTLLSVGASSASIT